MKEYTSVYRNLKTGAYLVQPFALGPTGKTASGGPILLSADVVDEKIGVSVLAVMDAIVPKLRELGARHVAYGAKPEHYGVVGATLITSLATIAGADWRPEHETAWTAAFGIVAATMLEGAAQAELEAAA